MIFCKDILAWLLCSESGPSPPFLVLEVCLHPPILKAAAPMPAAVQFTRPSPHLHCSIAGHWWSKATLPVLDHF